MIQEYKKWIKQNAPFYTKLQSSPYQAMELNEEMKTEATVPCQSVSDGWLNPNRTETFASQRVHIN